MSDAAARHNFLQHPLLQTPMQQSYSENQGGQNIILPQQDSQLQAGKYHQMIFKNQRHVWIKQEQSNHPMYHAPVRPVPAETINTHFSDICQSLPGLDFTSLPAYRALAVMSRP